MGFMFRSGPSMALSFLSWCTDPSVKRASQIWNHGSSGTLSAGAVTLNIFGFVRDQKILHVVQNLLEFVSHESLPVPS